MRIHHFPWFYTAYGILPKLYQTTRALMIYYIALHHIHLRVYSVSSSDSHPIQVFVTVQYLFDNNIKIITFVFRWDVCSQKETVITMHQKEDT